MNEQSYIYLNELEYERSKVMREIKKIQDQQTVPGKQYGETQLPLQWQQRINALKREERRISKASSLMQKILQQQSSQ